jgi:aromatic-L-amino-acid decarboxylase
VVATAGTTSASSIDPVRAIAAACRARDGERPVWLHVDAAYGGSAAVAPEYRFVLDGAELADSLVVNPHKWLFVPMDCSVLYVRRPDVVRRAFSLVPEYLTTREQDRVENLMDYGVQLGRRFRALKLWMVLRAFGAEGLAERIRYHVALAQEFAAWVRAEPGWEVAAPHPLSLVCFRHAPPGTGEREREALNARIMHDVNASGEAFLSHTKLGERYVLRLAIGNVRTERRHVERAWELLQAAAIQAAGGASPPSSGRTARGLGG